MARIISGIIFLIMVLPVQGQEKLSFADVNDSTYSLYEQHRWKNLISVGKKGLQQGYDYYYLRMRLGIAAYERQNYVRAIYHFRKALGFSSNDPIALEYLYYSYLFSGRTLEARAVFGKMPVSVKKKITTKNEGGLSSLNLSSGYYFVEQDGHSALQNTPADTSDRSWRTRLDQGPQANVLTGWNIGKTTTLYTGYQFLSVRRQLYTENVYQTIDDAKNVYNQHLFFTQLVVRPFRNATLGFSFDYVHQRPKFIIVQTSGDSIPGIYPRNDFSGYLSFQYQVPYFSIMAGTGVSNMNGYLQHQEEAGIIIYPLGNLNLYVISNIIHAFQMDTDPAFNESLFGTVTVGARIVDPLWLELFGSKGDRYNVQIEQGWTIYNKFNPVSEVYGANILINIPKAKMLVYAGFYKTTMASYYFYENQNVLYRNEPVLLHTTNINGGIKWTF